MSVEHEPIVIFARKLRQGMTETELFVWSKLRGRRFAGYKFRRQKPFHGYIVDFICVEHQLIIELDGRQHLEKVEYDKKRSDCFHQLGYTELRFWNHVALTEWETVEEVIWQQLQHKPSHFLLKRHESQLEFEMTSCSTPLTPGPSPLRGEGDK